MSKELLFSSCFSCLMIGVLLGLLLSTTHGDFDRSWRSPTPSEIEMLSRIPPLVVPIGSTPEVWGWKVNSKGWWRYQQLPSRKVFRMSFGTEVEKQ